ncbi:hypothetical protein QVD17_37926 [Tagetes erecta]|uniref:Uncharacterized protein n=1 Tax=Tagetes erecta TaxID=13708 RepID=A0AAD8NKH0_TARER|nr:hypothetical protein QVD17_37926 [Tagetes erecta]
MSNKPEIWRAKASWNLSSSLLLALRLCVGVADLLCCRLLVISLRRTQLSPKAVEMRISATQLNCYHSPSPIDLHLTSTNRSPATLDFTLRLPLSVACFSSRLESS